jgi:uncharacterized protein (DUF885 family)
LNTRRNLTFSALFLLLIAPLSHAQSLPAARSIPGMPPAPTSLEDRKKALDKVARDYWEDILKHSPELASAIGDTRYNDQVSNYTASAYNEAIGREQGYMMQLAVIDAAGFTDEENQLMHALMQRFEQDTRAADAKPWQTPIAASGSYYAVYPRLASELPFAAVKDYDDWIARLHALPEAFAQAQQSMSLGIDDGRVPSKEVLDKALAEVSALAAQKPEESPLSAPLKKFPSTVSAAEQDRIKQETLAAVEKTALPAYMRLERFLRVSYLTAAGEGSPAQPTSDTQLLYAVLDLRAKAEQAFGAKFNPEAFHQQILKTGLLPTVETQKTVETWITNGGR